MNISDSINSFNKTQPVQDKNDSWSGCEMDVITIIKVKIKTEKKTVELVQMQTKIENTWALADRSLDTNDQVYESQLIWILGQMSK